LSITTKQDQQPATRAKTNDAILAQDTAQQRKEELVKEKDMEQAREEFIEGLYYHQLYFSDACWKNDQRVVARNLGKLTLDASKYNALKENIMIQVKGFGWEWCKHAWLKNGRKYTINELANHLHHIIKKEKDHDIPIEPVLNIPSQMKLPTLGTETECVKELDRKYFADGDQFKRNACKVQHERESKKQGCIYASMQSFYAPPLCDLLNERIDVLVGFDIPGKIEKDLGWCQGEVIAVYEHQEQWVRVRWDLIPDCEGWEESMETDQILRPSKWNKDVNGAWRMDLPIDIEEATHSDESEDNAIECDSAVDMSDSGERECSSSVSSR
jgi:hypothetical protein